MNSLRLRLSVLSRTRSLSIWAATRLHIIQRTLLAVLLLFSCSFQLPSGSVQLGIRADPQSQLEPAASSPAAFLQVGEELIYRVSYWFIGLGEIRVRVMDKLQTNTETRYRAEVFVDSYGGNPFVNLHEVYETEFDSTLYAHHFQGRWMDGDAWKYVKYDFRYDINKIFIERGRYDLNLVESYDTVSINRKYQDGLSLFYFARGYVKSRQKTVIPTFIHEKKARTYFNFETNSTDQDIDSVSYPIDVLEFEGEADWVGIFGLTGGFSGKFSNDDASIPIVARMKVIIGSVKVELKSWKREGWVPPRYVEKD